MKISWKNIENWRSWKMRFFLGGHYEFSKSAILNFLIRPFWSFLLHISEKLSPFIWGIIFFLHYGWFFQNLAKEAVRTLMHTTVQLKICYLLNVNSKKNTLICLDLLKLSYQYLKTWIFPILIVVTYQRL